MGETCCLYRRKLVIGLLAVLSEEQCGVKDSEVADLIDFDVETPSGKPVIRVRFCPWCGTPWDGQTEQRVVDVDVEAVQPAPRPAPERPVLKCGGCGHDFYLPPGPTSLKHLGVKRSWHRCPECGHMTEY